jgi:hypothetical protein
MSGKYVEFVISAGEESSESLNAWEIYWLWY